MPRVKRGDLAFEITDVVMDAPPGVCTTSASEQRLFFHISSRIGDGFAFWPCNFVRLEGTAERRRTIVTPQLARTSRRSQTSGCWQNT